MADSDEEPQMQQEVIDEKEMVEDVDKKENDSDSDVWDNEEDGGEWITNDNLYSHIGGANTFNLMANEDN